MRRGATFPNALAVAGKGVMIAIAASLALVSQSALANDTQSANASARIHDDVTLINTREMDFGRIIAPGNGRIDMTASEVAICTPNNALEVLDGCQSAGFEGVAGSGFQIRVRVPAGRRIELTGPGQNLRLRRMEVGAGDGLAFIRRVNRNFDFTVTDPDGAFEFFVGGRLLIRNNQAPGVYTGTFEIEVEYE
ncbi:MAG: DUF4402 domain-containing protein [Erythrobacter sp.]|uniref:DUF4402 domain-containing protein n=1 Tax=Erythrobacter sp. TaxID=1042 RepID=UPI0026318E7B|nr:DUF4402 domain-containing protein [Erythrobacter sp.]MDJ0978221.1 DUF4402 domain-containing protein [Erythrobacter sp.]